LIQGTGGSSAWKVTESNASAANTARSTATIVDPVQVIRCKWKCAFCNSKCFSDSRNTTYATVMQKCGYSKCSWNRLTVTGYATAIIQIVSSPAMSGETVVDFGLLLMVRLINLYSLIKLD